MRKRVACEDAPTAAGPSFSDRKIYVRDFFILFALLECFNGKFAAGSVNAADPFLLYFPTPAFQLLDRFKD